MTHIARSHRTHTTTGPSGAITWWPRSAHPCTLGVNARGCRPTPSSRWRRTLSSPRLITGKFTDTAHLLETHTSWAYCRWYEEQWGGVSSRDRRQSFSRDSYLKSCVVTRVMHISVFPMSRVTVFHVEGAATVDEGDTCLIGQTVIDISHFHFSAIHVSFVPCSILPKRNEPNQLLGNAKITDAIWWNND